MGVYRFLFLAFISLIALARVSAQTTPNPAADAAKKSNARPAETVSTPEPFDGASVEKMASQCITLETELGAIEIGLMPEVAPESVRNFLNLAATGALDTTTFSRTVKDFVIQGGNLTTVSYTHLTLPTIYSV